MTKIKICGIKRADEVEILNQFAVSYAGFIFAKSKRQVSIDDCNRLSEKLDDKIKRVGVFVNEPIDKLLEVISKCRLDVVQLHGDESVDYIKQIPIKVWKTIPVKNQDSLTKVIKYEDEVSGILFETYHEKLKGGTGQTFDWHLLENLETKENLEVILAGGINPLNAKEAIDIVKPDILDVNSGLEVEGYKTLDKVKQLFKELNLWVDLEFMAVNMYQNH